ncbi:MAG: hypothetical protein ABI456_17600 [Ktedonobacteraceae bacterium]
MRDATCPNCNEPLPESARQCAACGETLSLSDNPATAPASIEEGIEAGEDEANISTVKLPPRLRDQARKLQQSLVRETPLLIEDAASPDGLANAITQNRLPVADVPRQQLRTTPGSGPSMSRYIQARTTAAHSLPARTRSPYHLGPAMFFWLSVLLVAALVVGGLFGVVTALGRGNSVQSPPDHSQPTLQITPAAVALGATITLRGSNFSPRSTVGLSRDTNIPVFDTDIKHIIQADSTGSFTDTVTVAPEWQPGTHVIHVEDATLHKTAGFTLLVTGHGSSLRPPHLELSTPMLDLGSGDQATNSSQIIVMSNAGGGQITWQTSATQSWLMVSPTSGTFSNGQTVQVTVAADRSNLKPGAYSAAVLFITSAGQSSLSARMKVTPLDPGHEAVLQLTPAVFSFTGSDGGANPPAQVVTVSNPGVRPLSWQASIAYQAGTPGWLSAYPLSDTLAKNSSEPVTINANTTSLLPGTYSAYIIFSATGPLPVKDSPQSIFISLTVNPQCMLQVSPGNLAFTAVYLQGGPPSKVINLGLSQGCTTPLRWSASSTVRWLSISPAKAVTPTAPSVSVNIAGLAPGSYSGSIVFSALSGTQTLPVSLAIARPTTPIMATTPATLGFQGVIGQPAPAQQRITVTNNGGGNLVWSATTATTMGTGWLAITPASGSLTARASATLTVTVSIPPGLPANTYTAMITISGTDGSGHNAVGSPQSIPVNFLLQAPCTITTANLALSFAGVSSQPNPPAQAVTITTSGACAHTLDWTTSATTSSGGSWLTTAPATGTLNPASSTSTGVHVALAGLSAGSYSGKITIAATDSVTGQPAIAQPVSVTLNVQPPCTLQTPSTTVETFNAEVGSSPTSQSFTVGVTGACSGAVTIAPAASAGSGAGWLTITPASATLTSGEVVTFTVKVVASTLGGGTYKGSLSLAAVNGGMAITGSPQAVSVLLNVQALPALSAGPGSLPFNVTTGVTSQAVTISNTGGAPLNWSATLDTGAPAFVSLSSGSGMKLTGGTSTSLNVTVDATGLAGGSTFSASATVRATDADTGNPVTGSPATIVITIKVAQPAMQLSTLGLSFTTTTGQNPASQSITLTNTGGNTLAWSSGTPSQSWLSVDVSSGNDPASSSSTLTFSVNTTGMLAGTYTATVTITPSVGSATVVTVTLTINP